LDSKPCYTPLMKPYLILLRGINVGGNSLLPMAKLKKSLEAAGFSDVSTYIASGNALVRSDKTPAQIKTIIEKNLLSLFKKDAPLIKVLVLDHTQLKSIIKNKPKGFGEKPDLYHSDVIFLMEGTAKKAMTAFSPKEGVDTVWPGKGAIYSQRLSAQRTKSRLNKIMSTPFYKTMTIRTWNTATKLLALLEAMEAR